MCGIAGIFHVQHQANPHLTRQVGVMNKLLGHRGPDDERQWTHSKNFIGFGHRRLTIIDLVTGSQPMSDHRNNVICFNGEIYNYIELREELKNDFPFRTHSDTEVILAAYQKWGTDCVNHLRGMFAFAIWDEVHQVLFCARDRFGIKPFYYLLQDGVFYFASEPKALLPFLHQANINLDALREYLIFQFYLEGKILFQDIQELLPAHRILIKNGHMAISRYWEIYYNPDFDHTPKYFEEKLHSLLVDTMKFHLRSEVPIGCYLSGGTDSSIVAALASKHYPVNEFAAFHGKFSFKDSYDESSYARLLAQEKGIQLYEVDINSQDFVQSIRKVIYQLDYPIAGPGSFPQYHVSKLAASHRKVLLGGQGGDEIFGGYIRYLIAYFEQCIKGAIRGTLHGGNYIVSYESIIPNLVLLANYQPSLQEFWRDGLFDELDKRYFRLINRSHTFHEEINWQAIGEYNPFETFSRLFNGTNVGKESYFDKMTHFDFKTLLPALLQVEDRMSMAHGLESRVPFLDHPLVEFAATMPSNIKFKDGTPKKILTDTMGGEVPAAIINRKNKMGFPVPLTEWLQGELKGFFYDIFSTEKTKTRPYFNVPHILTSLSTESQFGRKLWGLLSLEIWHQEFIDRHSEFRKLI